MGCEARGVVLGGACAAVAIGALLGREDTLDEMRVGVERVLHARDLEHVDADACERHGYSTVTDLARLRGLSTSRPRASAT